MPDDADKIWSVSDVNRVVKELLEQTFRPFWIAGEVSNLTLHRSGHVYFTLKDRRCQLKAVFFNGADQARALGICEGMEVEVQGRLTVYEARGNYQISVRRMRPGGIGALQQQFEQIKRRLQAEGLFAETRKRPVPMLPACIGVVTSPEGAALRDFLQVLGRRFAGLHVRIYPATVQGPATADEVIAGLERLNRESDVDVIVITRGGGSLEDLWGFNDERLARAVAGSRTPVISAVGHEVDFTICDFVADLRVPTPSAAAELVCGRQAELRQRVTELRRRTQQILELRVSRLRLRVLRAARSPVLREPVHLVRSYQQRVDDLTTRLGAGIRRQLERNGERLRRSRDQLRLLDPANVLRRGYAILIARETGAAVTAAANVRAGDRLRGILADGEIDLQVRDSA